MISTCSASRCRISTNATDFGLAERAANGRAAGRGFRPPSLANARIERPDCLSASNASRASSSVHGGGMNGAGGRLRQLLGDQERPRSELGHREPDALDDVNDVGEMRANDGRARLLVRPRIRPRFLTIRLGNGLEVSATVSSGRGGCLTCGSSPRRRMRSSY
jgi:hypothetical protein